MENSEMKDRIAHIIRAKNLTAAEFALRLGIQPSNVSHLLSGRNNPSLDFVKKLKETFPEYSLDWIVLGVGPITVSEPFLAATPTPKGLEPAEGQEEDDDALEGTLFGQPKEAEAQTEPVRPTEGRVLQRMIMVYSDHTFEEFLPR